MIRPSRILLGAGGVAATCALVMASPLAASAAPVEWDGSTDQYWNVGANWSTGVVPVAGDRLIFPVGVSGTSTTEAESNNILADPFVADGLDVAASYFLIEGSALAIDPTGTVGLSVSGSAVRITPELRLNGPQTISVTSTGAVTFPSNIRVESGVTTFDIAEGGFASVNALDGIGFAGGVVKTGEGILEINGAGGVADGVQVQEGSVHLTGDGAGTGWVLDGGTISGNGLMERLAADSGRLAPGDDYFGVGIDTLEIWNLFTATTSTALALQLQADGSNDSIYTLEGTQIDGAMLELDLEPGTAVGTEWTILEQEREEGPEYFWNFTTPDGVPIVEGEPFALYGDLFSLETVDRTVFVTYLGDAPVVPAKPALAATGLDGAAAVPALAVAGGVLVAGAAALILARRMRRASCD